MKRRITLHTIIAATFAGVFSSEALAQQTRIYTAAHQDLESCGGRMARGFNAGGVPEISRG